MIWFPCEKNCKETNQYACRENGERAFELLRTEGEPGEALIFAECGNCGALHCILEEEWNEAGQQMNRRAAVRRANLTRYPRIEPHTGELVKSRDHEMEVVKHMGYHVAEHGVNDAHNDELAEKLRSQRIAREERRRKIQKKRETLIREGVIKAPKRTG